jgi:hypothetical protein
MNMKQIALFALILCLTLAALSFCAFAADSPAPDGLFERFAPLLDEGLDALTDWLGGQTDKLPPELRETLRDADTDALFSDLADLVGETRGMNDDELRSAILALAERHGVHLVDSQVAQLMKLCRTLERLDTRELKERIDALKEALDDAAPGGLRGVWSAVVRAVTDAASWIARTFAKLF